MQFCFFLLLCKLQDFFSCKKNGRMSIKFFQLIMNNCDQFWKNLYLVRKLQEIIDNF